MTAHDACRLLARTINFAHSLDAVHGGEPTKMVQADDFQICADRGFSAVRLPIQFVDHLTHDGVEVDPTFLVQIDEMVSQARSAGLAVVIANHLDPELMEDPQQHRQRLYQMWSELARHYRHADPSVMLEPLAEPIDALCPIWNDVLADVLNQIRPHCPDRPVVVGPTHYNNMRFLHELMLPEDDRNLIVSIHHYYPIEFTMQGEEWLQYGDPRSWLGNTFEADERTAAMFAGAMDGVATWASKHDRPVFMGEFGTSSNADTRSRVAWTKLSRSLAEKRGFAWGYWAFSQTFAAYDREGEGWIRPIAEALLEG